MTELTTTIETTETKEQPKKLNVITTNKIKPKKYELVERQSKEPMEKLFLTTRNMDQISKDNKRKRIMRNKRAIEEKKITDRLEELKKKEAELMAREKEIKKLEAKIKSQSLELREFHNKENDLIKKSPGRPKKKEG